MAYKDGTLKIRTISYDNKMKANTKNTIISLLIIVAILGVVIFLSSLATDTDFGGSGYVFLLIFICLISGLITVFLRLIRLIKNTETLLYNFIGTFNLTIASIFFIWEAFLRLRNGSFTAINFFGVIFIIQLLLGTFILFDIYKINRIFSKTDKKLN